MILLYFSSLFHLCFTFPYIRNFFLSSLVYTKWPAVLGLAYVAKAFVQYVSIVGRGEASIHSWWCYNPMNLSIWNTPCSASQYQNQFQILNLHSLSLALFSARYRSTCSIRSSSSSPPSHPFMCSCPVLVCVCINTATNFDLLVHKITIYSFSPFFNLYYQVWNSRSLQSIFYCLLKRDNKGNKTQNQAVWLLRSD